MKRVIEHARKTVVSICISCAMLAVANFETIWQEYHHAKLQENLSEVRSVQDFTQEMKPVAPVRTSASETKVKELSMADQLRASLEQDELLEANPFKGLSNLTALNEITGRAIAKFRRETFRSPIYRDESGYDLLSYEIDNKDGSRSSILAYLENEKDGLRVPFVVLITPTLSGENSYYFRGGRLLEHTRLTATEAQTLISRRLSGGLPFLSVSR